MGVASTSCSKELLTVQHIRSLGKVFAIGRPQEYVHTVYARSPAHDSPHILGPNYRSQSVRFCPNIQPRPNVGLKWPPTKGADVFVVHLSATREVFPSTAAIKRRFGAINPCQAIDPSQNRFLQHFMDRWTCTFENRGTVSIYLSVGDIAAGQSSGNGGQAAGHPISPVRTLPASLFPAHINLNQCTRVIQHLTDAVSD